MVMQVFTVHAEAIGEWDTGMPKANNYGRGFRRCSTRWVLALPELRIGQTFHRGKSGFPLVVHEREIFCSWLIHLLNYRLSFRPNEHQLLFYPIGT